MIETHHKTVFVYASFIITVAGWWAWNAFLSGVYSSNISPYDVKGGFTHGFGVDPNWWATFALALIILIVLEVAGKAGEQYWRRTRMAGARQDAEWSAPVRDESWREKEPKRATRTRTWLWPWKRERIEAAWDVGVWQEIEAEGGLRERVLAMAGGVEEDLDRSVEAMDDMP